ncbi:MAG TPA: PAS domain S-box protein, partial [Longimicrobium sp.]|nr:PAS domain S-box protein [Longimicrobium sp.]
FDVVPVARHMVIESLGDAVYVLDSDQRLVDLNRAARAQLGAGGRDPVGRPAAEVLPIPLHRLPADGGRVEVEDGASPPGRYLELRVHALTGAAGEPVGRVVVVCDVTGRRRTEEALRAARDELEERVRERTAALEDAVASLRLEVSQRTQAEAQLREEEARFRTVVENLSEAVLLTDLDGIVTFASERIEEVTGYPPAELVGRRAGHVLLAEDELRAADERLEDRRAGRSGRWEVPITRKDGSTGRVEVIGTAIRDAEGRTVGGLDAVTDVTERHRAEAELHAVRERFRLLVETVRDYAIVAVDPDGYVVSWNAGAERIAGYTAEQILGRHVSVFYPPEEAAQGEPQRMLETALREGSAEVEGWRVRADGSRHWTNTVLTPLRDGSGTLVGYAAITRDLTDRRAAELALRRSEEQLRHSQKMEAVGRLAGGIAHDFNNVLMAVGGHVQLLLRRTGEDDPRRASLLEIRKGVDRAAALVRQLLAFSRTQAMEPRVLDLREVVSGMDGMLRGVLGDGVRLELRLDPATPAVRADAGQLEQVIMNLVVNARDAMPGGGTIRVRTAAAPAGGEEGGTDSGLPPGRYALLAVADDGYGIDAAALPHVFEPFFTTKEEGKGTGLGLSTVYGIVTQSGGAVTVESTPGVETTFRVFLPAVQEEVEDGPPARLSAAGRVPRGGETVLLAEDDDGARAAAREALRLSGYRVLEARSGAEALELAESHGAAIHLLLAGGALPGPAGPELARRVRALHPEARVLHLPAPAGAGAAGRPAPAEALARRVREALDRPAEVVR